MLHSLVSEETAKALATLAQSTPAGAFVEVGVYKGGTAWHLSKAAEEQNRSCYLYDTFTGIPYKASMDHHPVGDFGNTSAQEVKEAIPYATVIEGIFPQSAIEMGPIAFVHLDVDQYQSYQEAFAYFQPRMVKGGIIWCDDVGCLAGADLAFKEFCETYAMIPIIAEKTYIRF